MISTPFEELCINGLPGLVYRSRMPNSLYESDEEAENLLSNWQSNGITNVVCLQLKEEMERYTAMHLPEELYPELNLQCLWHPMPDHHGSDNPQKLLDDATRICSIIAKGVKVVIHCHAGIGRTGMFIGAMLISKGLSVDEAIYNLRDSSPRLKYSVNQKQRDCLLMVSSLMEGIQ